MNCQFYRRQIEFYLDGELSLQEETELRGHLEVCSACRQHKADTLALWGQLAGIELEPPGDIVGPVLARLARRKTWRRVGIAALLLLGAGSFFPILAQGALFIRAALLSLDWQWLLALFATVLQAVKVLYKGWTVLAEALPQEWWLVLTCLAIIDLAMLIKIFRFKPVKGGMA